MTAEINYREAIARALADELESDPRVVLIGEDVGAAGGVFKSTAGLFERFGASRVRDTPISEQAIVGTALGAAIMGLRPVAEIMFADFAGVCFDQIANQLAKYRYMTGAKPECPSPCAWPMVPEQDSRHSTRNRSRTGSSTFPGSRSPSPPPG